VASFGRPSTGELGCIRHRRAQMKAAQAEHPDLLYATLARTSDQFVTEWTDIVRDEGVLFLQGYGRGVRALGRLATYSRYLRRHGVTAPRAHTSIQVDLPIGQSVLNEVEAKDVLRAAGLPVLPTRWARTPDEAVEQAEALGYPVAAKVIAPQLTHKSDVGGVRLHLADAAAVHQAFGELQAVAAAVPGAEFQGVAVQPMAAPALELALGANRDPQ